MFITNVGLCPLQGISHSIALLLVSTVVIQHGADSMRTLRSTAPGQAHSLTDATTRHQETGGTVPCFQGDVAVEQPVVLRAAGVLATGRTLGRSGAVCGRGARVAPRRVVAPVQGVNGGRMVLMVGRVGVGER